jgi:heat shock protein HslJ
MPSPHAAHAEHTTRRWRWVAVAALALTGLGLAACGDDSGSSADATAAPAALANTGLASSSWVLSTYSAAGKDVPAVARPEAPLDFSDTDALSGSTGCNQFAGTYTADDSALTITLGPVTQRACESTILQAQETAVLALLPKVASYSIDSDTLTMKDGNDAEVLVYTLGLTSLEGTDWTATGINNGKQAVEANAQTGSVTARFGTAGALSGSAGCNDYNATYTVAGTDGLTIGPIASTKKICPDDVMTTENAYFTALAASTKYKISGDTLTLTDDAGSTQVTYTLAS